MSNKNDQLILNHYQEEARKHGCKQTATMPDKIYRDKEIELVTNFIRKVMNDKSDNCLRILDLGCGNGAALSLVSESLSSNIYWGIDFCSDFISIANDRNLSNCTFNHGDARSLDFEDNFFDIVYSERCLINILDWEEQKLALKELYRVLKPEGFYLMLENFTDGLNNINKARSEFGLKALKEAYHNKYFDKKLFFDYINPMFTNINPVQLNSNLIDYEFTNNYMSSYFFISRFLHALLSTAVNAEFVRDTEFVKFFSFLPPIGNYAAPQAHYLQKKLS